MIQMPRLKNSLSIVPVSETRWSLVSGGASGERRVDLTDEAAVRAFGSLLPWLTGKHEIEEILAGIAAAGGDRDVALLLLSRLEELHCLEEGGDGGLSSAELERFASQISHFSQFGTKGGARLQKSLRESRVGLIAGGPLSGILRRDLEEAGVGEVLLLSGEGTGLALDRSSIWPSSAAVPLPDLLVMPQEVHDPDLLEAINTFSCQREVPWLLVRSLSVQEGWVGPLFIPGKTASYLSLEARLRGNLPFFEEYEAFDLHVRKSGRPGPAGGGLRPNLEVLSGIAVAEIVKLLTGYQPLSLAGRFLSVNLMTWETEIHHVLRVPHMDEADSPEYQKIPWKKEAVHG